MKRVLSLFFFLLLISSVAMADHIGLFKDASGSSCNLGSPGFNTTATMIHKFSAGATGSRFKVAFPPGSSFFAFNTQFTPVGLLTMDLSLGYGQCLSGCIVLGSIVAILGAGQATVLPADTFPNIIYTNCLFAELPATGGQAYVGGSENCSEVLQMQGNAVLADCTVAVAPSTWGSVKSLYR